MWRKFKLSTRILMLGLVIIGCFGLMFVWLQPKLKQNMYDAKYLKTRHIVEAAWSILDHHVKLAETKVMAPDEARLAAIAAIKQMRYEEKDYFWINDLTPRMIMHPYKPQLDGKDLTNTKDPNGKRLFMEMVAVCKKSGAGFVEYYWPKPGEPDPVPKISYVKLQPKWGWMVGSGIYVDDVENEIARIFNKIFAAVFVIATLGIFLSYLMARSIARPVSRVVDGIDQGAAQVAASASQVASSSQALAQNASEQAASVEETTSTLVEMGTMSRETSQITSGVHQLMNKNIEKSGKSLKALAELTRKMSQIEEDSDSIAQIIKTIDEIAFQTNLLALNAAVEAARAGEAGAGFAVVADEVRNLALRATDAAKNTQELLDTTMTRVSESARAIKQVNNDFEGIIETATIMGEKTDSITTGSEQQADGIEQISKANLGIDDVTQQMAANAEESASAAEELSAQAVEMRSFVNQLVGVIGGDRLSAKKINLKKNNRKAGLPMGKSGLFRRNSKGGSSVKQQNPQQHPYPPAPISNSDDISDF